MKHGVRGLVFKKLNQYSMRFLPLNEHNDAATLPPVFGGPANMRLKD